MTANPFDSGEQVSNGADIDLSAFDADFAAAEAPDFEELPDGKYQVKIDKAVLTQTRSSGEPMIRWELVVISGPFEGRRIFKNSVFTQAALPYIKGDFNRLNLEMSSLKELPARLREALDKTLEVTVKTKGENHNCFFNKPLNIPASATNPKDVPW